ncbi:MAG: SIMPL domain-containing protein [Chloroflexi bacterium]|nr:SIMPL domain-containing protein [Chloroflexota bacterium]
MFKRVSTLPFLIAMLALAAAPACAGDRSGDAANLRTINVSGSGTAHGSPDIATAQISVVTRDEKVKIASDDNTRLMAGVISALTKVGVEDKDIQTSNFTITIQQVTNPDGTLSDKREFVIENAVRVKFRDLSKVGEGLQDAIGAGANQISDIQFGVENTAALAAEAREKAMADAKARADQLAKAAGVTIDKPFTISEAYYTNYGVSQRQVAAPLSADSGQPVPVQPGQISVQVDVSVTYLIK